MKRADFERLSKFEFQQSIRCCNVTAIAYAVTGLGFPMSIDDVFYATHLPISSVLDDGMTLAETYDTCRKLIEIAKLPLLARVEHFDKPSMTFPVFVEELERGAVNENDIHLLNFNVNIAHDAPLGGGHFALLADYDPATQEMVIADTNPRKYTRFWTCPAERMYRACVDKDSASERSRGLIILRKT